MSKFVVPFVLLLVSSAALAGTPQVASDGRIATVSYAGDGNVTLVEGERYIWLSDRHRFEVTLESSEGIDDAAVCLAIAADESEDEEWETCESTSIPAEDVRNVTVSLDEWPANLTGTQDVRISLRTPNASGEVMDRESLSVTVIRREADHDDDGLSNEREVSLGTDFRDPDTDDDGLDDGTEVNTYETAPTNDDTDGDGLADRDELLTHRTDPSDPDTDGDGLGDDRELAIGTNPNRADTDGDGLDDAAEVNTYETNATVADTDGDGLGDEAEIGQYDTNPTDPDTDGDGLEDALEIHTYETDPNAIDTDGDGLEDGAEVDEYDTDPTDPDTDGDGLDDGEEVNKFETDPLVVDTDGDGLDDGEEVHEFGTNPTEADTDGDGVDDRQEVSEGFLTRVSLPGLLAAAVFLIGVVGLLYVTIERTQYRLPRPALARNERDESNPEIGRGLEDVPPEYLPNRERVLVLLDEHDGRIRQSEIVEETDWSKSKVSRILSDMEADEQIAKIDVGRGNIVTRPEDASSESRSILDE